MSAELYAAYRQELNAERMTHHVRMGAMVSLILQTCFILLDWYAYPEYFGFFLAVRLTLNALLVAIYVRTSATHPVVSEVALCLVMGTGMLALIYGAGATESGYYAGLILVFVGMGVLLPLTALQSAGICGVLLGTFAMAPLFIPGPTDWATFTPHLVFLSAAAAMSVASCSFLDRTRARDFAQRRAIERARDELAQLDVEKSRFTANVHHELRTPLALMLAPIEGLLGREFGAISDLQERYLRSMHANGLRLLKLINNLLELAKIEGGQLRIRRRPVRLRQLVEQLVEAARPLAERKGVALEARGLDEVPEMYLDPDAMEKVLVNLIGNALKFTDAGGVIEVIAEPAEDGLRLVVSDTGIGLPPEQLDRIFDRFAQVDGSTTRRHEGTGIGRALVRELVELHGGRIWAESEGLNRGTRICLVLPRGEADAEAAEELVEAAEPAAPARRRDALAEIGSQLGVEDRNRDALRMADLSWTVARHEDAAPDSEREVLVHESVPADAPEVLVCDDNPDMRRLVSHFVGREYRVRVAANGREGLEAVRERHPDLVLTDVMMPEMSGTELCQTLKNDPRTAGIPVLLVTSKAEREMKIEGLELGADDYVTKPFHPRELMARVRSFVKLRCLQQELAVGNARLESTNVELEATLRELREATVQLAQAERLSAVGELAAGVAHEVNNPVNFAMNSLRTLRDYVDDVRSVIERISALDWSDPRKLERELRELEKLRKRVEFDDLADSLCELVDIVNEGLERTHRLVGDLRDLAAPAAGRQDGVSLLRGLETTIQLVKHSYRDAGVELEVDLPGALPPVAGDPRALNQVFLNLLKNAAEAFEEPGGTVWVTAEAGESEIQVRFRDDGPGVPADVRARIFQPFFTTKGAGRGSGLGLSISRRIVTEHGGSLELSSEPGQGTTFTVTLPLQGEDRAT